MLATKLSRKCADARGGVNRLIAILLFLLVLLLLSIVIPAYLRYQHRAEQIGCTFAVDKADDMMSIETLFEGSLTVQEAAVVVDKSLYRRDELCPGGGDFFLVHQEENAEKEYKVVCGLHDPDTKERTRLCSGAALKRLLDAIELAQKDGKDPQTLKIRLNGKNLSCKRVEEKQDVFFGTKMDIDHKGIVCFYALAGDAAARETVEQAEKIDLSKLADGDVWYFAYADENHASVWVYSKGWTGDAWIF